MSLYDIQTMKACMADSSYQFLADFVDESTITEESGRRIREWDFDSAVTLRVRAQPVAGGTGVRGLGSGRDWSGPDLEDVEWMRLYVATLTVPGIINITKSTRATNVTTIDGQPLWEESTGSSIIFGVQGITPVLDPFNNIQEFELVMKGVTND